MNEDHSDWAALEAGASSDDDADGTFKPEYAMWASKGSLKGKGQAGFRPRGAPSTALNRHRAKHQVCAAGTPQAQHHVCPLHF